MTWPRGRPDRCNRPADQLELVTGHAVDPVTGSDPREVRTWSPGPDSETRRFRYWIGAMGSGTDRYRWGRPHRDTGHHASHRG